jgi:hypothetical protein
VRAAPSATTVPGQPSEREASRTGGQRLIRSPRHRLRTADTAEIKGDWRRRQRRCLVTLVGHLLFHRLILHRQAQFHSAPEQRRGPWNTAPHGERCLCRPCLSRADGLDGRRQSLQVEPDARAALPLASGLPWWCRNGRKSWAVLGGMPAESRTRCRPCPRPGRAAGPVPAAGHA